MAGTGTVTFDPWVLLQASFAIDPAVVPAGDSAPLQGSLLIDSTMTDLPDDMAPGIVMTFAGGPLGTVDPATAGTEASVATTTWTAGNVPGMDVATVILDNESLDVPVEVLPAIDVIEVPTQSTWGLTLLIALLSLVALRRLRRSQRVSG